MSITKVSRNLLNTGVSDSSDATAITIDSSENITLTGDISLADSKKVNIGAGNDLQIYHDGSNSFIKEAGTGGLYMPTSAVYMRNAADSAGVAYFVDGGAVTLYHDGTSKFATSSNGGIMYGGITFNGDTATANLLDDYEEGTWTPAIAGSTNLTTFNAEYIKIGRKVYAYFYVAFNPVSNSNQFEITGLPYGQSGTHYGGGTINYTGAANWSDAYGPIIAGSTIYFHKNSGTSASFTNANVYSKTSGSQQYLLVNIHFYTA